jgi:ribosome-binding factor A
MKRVVLKYTPQLHFEIDHALERGDRVMQIMDEIEIPPDPPVASDPTDDQE